MRNGDYRMRRRTANCFHLFGTIHNESTDNNQSPDHDEPSVDNQSPNHDAALGSIRSIGSLFYAFFDDTGWRNDAFQYSNQRRMGELWPVATTLCGLQRALPRCGLVDDPRHLIAFAERQRN
jgi:hypothetical protein